MTHSLHRKKRQSNIINPFLELEQKEQKTKRELLKTMKVPEQTHQKLLSLAKMKNRKLYEMIDDLAEYYIHEALSSEEQQVYIFMREK